MKARYRQQPADAGTVLPDEAAKGMHGAAWEAAPYLAAARRGA